MKEKKRYRAKIMIDGRAHYTSGKTAKEAKKKALLLKEELLNGEQRATGSMTVSEWSKRWLRLYKEPQVSEYYYDCIDSQIRRQILPRIGSMQLRAVSPDDVQGILNEMADAGLSMSYIQSVRDLLNGLFRKARQNRYITYNPADSLELPTSKPKQKRRAITDRERELTLKVATYHYGGLFVLIVLYTGCRPQEVAALKWSDIDFNGRTISITKALKPNNIIGKTKTGAGMRLIIIPAPLLCILKEKQGDPSAHVVVNTQGGRYSHSSITHMFKSFRQAMATEAGEPMADDLTLYCYRHTYASDMVSAGVHIDTIKRLMGHANISTTSDIYSHLTATAFDEARTKIDRFFE